MSLTFRPSLQDLMPITINKSLPSIDSHLGLVLEIDGCMCMLVDTGATMNTGNKKYHLRAMS